MGMEERSMQPFKCKGVSMISVQLLLLANMMPIACGGDINTPTVAPTSDPVDAPSNKQGELFERWIGMMDPFVTQNEDWTFSLDWEAFLGAIAETDPEIVAYFRGSGEGNDDTTIIETLRDGIPIANVEMLERYEQYQNLPDNAQPAIWSVGYWWGRKVCYTGSDADVAQDILCYTAIVMGAWIPVPAAYVGWMCYNANQCNDRYSQFCNNFTWAGIFWTTCS